MNYIEKFGLVLMLFAIYGRIIATSDMWEIVALIAFWVGAGVFLIGHLIDTNIK